MIEQDAQQQQQGRAGGAEAERRVDVFVAEAIALTIPGRAASVLGVVEIREGLEGETVREALDLLRQVFELPDPYGGLRRIARRRGLGFYRPAAADPVDPARSWRGFCSYVEEKRARGDAETSAEELAARFYAPRQRAAMASISEAVWESYGRTPESSAPREGGIGPRARRARSSLTGRVRCPARRHPGQHAPPANRARPTRGARASLREDPEPPLETTATVAIVGWADSGAWPSATSGTQQRGMRGWGSRPRSSGGWPVKPAVRTGR